MTDIALVIEIGNSNNEHSVIVRVPVGSVEEATAKAAAFRIALSGSNWAIGVEKPTIHPLEGRGAQP